MQDCVNISSRWIAISLSMLVIHGHHFQKGWLVTRGNFCSQVHHCTASKVGNQWVCPKIYIFQWALFWYHNQCFMIDDSLTLFYKGIVFCSSPYLVSQTGEQYFMFVDLHLYSVVVRKRRLKVFHGTELPLGVATLGLLYSCTWFGLVELDFWGA